MMEHASPIPAGRSAGTRHAGTCQAAAGRSIRAAALGLLIALAPVIAGAADNGLYLGAAVSEPSTDYDFSFATGASGSVEDDSGFKLIAGIRPLDPLAIELDYVDFGSSETALNIVCITPPCPDRASVDVTALSISVIGFKQFPLLDLYGRIGMASWELDPSVRNLGSVPSDDGTDATYGVGVQFRLQSLGIRVEWESFDFASSSSDLFSVGLTWTFL